MPETPTIAFEDLTFEQPGYVGISLDGTDSQELTKLGMATIRDPKEYFAEAFKVLSADPVNGQVTPKQRAVLRKAMIIGVGSALDESLEVGYLVKDGVRIIVETAEEGPEGALAEAAE